jgi:hypothetical protein
VLRKELRAEWARSDLTDAPRARKPRSGEDRTAPREGARTPRGGVSRAAATPEHPSGG